MDQSIDERLAKRRVRRGAVVAKLVCIERERHLAPLAAAARPDAFPVIAKVPTGTPAELRRAIDEAERSAPPLQLQDAPSENLEVLRAELAATLTELRALVLVLRRTGGYLPSADQVALRSAMARLALHGRSVEDAPGRSTRP